MTTEPNTEQVHVIRESLEMAIAHRDRNGEQEGPGRDRLVEIRGDATARILDLTSLSQDERNWLADELRTYSYYCEDMFGDGGQSGAFDWAFKAGVARSLAGSL